MSDEQGIIAEPVWPVDSVRRPLMEREVCGACGHLHRVILAQKCGCCQTDVRMK